eukprot:scaffold18466_cov87-Skeletonema_dohrnii-CCMP3373.AAC.2
MFGVVSSAVRGAEQEQKSGEKRGRSRCECNTLVMHAHAPDRIGSLDIYLSRWREGEGERER